MAQNQHTFEVGPRLSQFLTETQELWQASIQHRFIDELFNDTLDPKVFCRYLIQDYQFFEAFICMLGSCVARADSMKAKIRFSQQLGFLASDEDSYFLKAFGQFGVPEADYSQPELDATTRQFQELMYSVSRDGSYAELLVMLVIAEGLYLDWGSLQRELPENDLYRGWIDLHRGNSFKQWVNFLAGELERQLLDGEQVQTLLPLWRKALQLEYDFFELGYKALS